MQKVIFLDRDGVINQDSTSYIKSADEFILIPSSIEAIARLTKAGFTIGVATNQSGITRGLYTEADLEKIHAKLLSTVRSAGGEIAAIEYCGHTPEMGCSCRKPKPGMLYNLARRLNCSLNTVHFIGDRVSDIKAAEAVGAIPLMVLSAMTDHINLQHYPHVPRFHSLAEAVDFILETVATTSDLVTTF